MISSGLSGDPALAGALLDAIRRHDLRMVGPNCLGIANTDPAVRLDATFAEPAPAGSVGLVTQSGGVALALQEELARLGLGVSTAVSTGRQVRRQRQRHAAVVAPRRAGPGWRCCTWSRSATRASSPASPAGSPSACRCSRSGRAARRAGQRAAASHTASTATPRVTRDALFWQAGVLAVDRLDELSELVATLSWQPLPTGRRTAVISNVGGVGVLAADACEARRLTVPTLSDRTQRALRRLLPSGAATAGPVDTTAVVSSDLFASAVSAVRADPDVDAVLAVTAATALIDPFPGVAAAGGRRAPVVAVRPGQAEHVTGLAVAGTDRMVPVFADAAAAAGALAQAATRAEWLARPRGVTTPVAGIDRVRAGGIVARVLADRPEGGWLEPAQAQDVLAAFGLPVLAGTVVDGPDDAVAAFTAVGRPVALKAVADGVLHKGAAGAVRLGLDSADAVRRAAGEFSSLFGPRLRGYLVQPMAPAGTELLVGVTSEPVFGPLVAVGLGGTATDLIADRVHRLVPLTHADAEEMLVAFHAGALLFDPHRSPPVDRHAVVDTIVRIGRLADELPEVAELDLNPLTVGADGCLVVDARIRVAPTPTTDPALRALGY